MFMAAVPDTRGFRGDSRERGRTPIEATMESRASSRHPGHNEDAALGDAARIRRELAKPPEINTSNKDADLEAVRRAGKTEMEHAGALKERGVFGVADGVSGSKSGGAGLVASRLASAKVAEIMSSMPRDAGAEQALPSIESAIKQAHQAILEYRRGRRDLKEAATTMDVIKTVENADGTFDVAYGHVGDSRIYVFDPETGALDVKTMDDSMATLFLKGGEISGEGKTARVAPRLTREQYDRIVQADSADSLPDDLKMFFKMRNVITSAVGFPAPDIKVQTGVFKVKRGERVLITTDGIHDNLTDAQIAEIMRGGAGVKELVEAASAIAESGRGRAKKDDITGVEVPLGESAGSGERPAAGRPQAMSPEQRSLTEEAIRDASAEVAALEDLKRFGLEADRATKEGKATRGFDFNDLQRIQQYGGIEGVDERIRDIKIYALSHEYQLLQNDVAARQREVGIDPAQAEKDLAEQKNIVDWQNQVIEAARQSGTKGGLTMHGETSAAAMLFVGERLKSGLSAAEVARRAEKLKVEAERKAETLAAASRDAARLAEIANEWRALAAEKQEARRRREQQRLAEARRDVGSIYEGGGRAAARLAENPPTMPRDAKKKPLWKFW